MFKHIGPLRPHEHHSQFYLAKGTCKQIAQLTSAWRELHPVASAADSGWTCSVMSRFYIVGACWTRVRVNDPSFSRRMIIYPGNFEKWNQFGYSGSSSSSSGSSGIPFFTTLHAALKLADSIQPGCNDNDGGDPCIAWRVEFRSDEWASLLASGDMLAPESADVVPCWRFMRSLRLASTDRCRVYQCKAYLRWFSTAYVCLDDVLALCASMERSQAQLCLTSAIDQLQNQFRVLQAEQALVHNRLRQLEHDADTEPTSEDDSTDN